MRSGEVEKWRSGDGTREIDGTSGTVRGVGLVVFKVCVALIV